VEDGRDKIIPGRYLAEIAIAAGDIDARYFSVEIQLDGSWPDDSTIWNT
jgi:hypothetical protein